MATTSDDIAIVLSGGSVNLNPSLSLGGDPSYSPIPSGVINNLFGDVPSERTEDLESYRCIYVFNDGDTTIWDIELWIQQTDEDGSQMEIGVLSTDEVQRITIPATVSGGDLVLRYKNAIFTLEYNSNLSAWANQLQTLLEELADPSDSSLFFRNVTVNAQNTSGLILFDIIWSGKDSKRNFDKIEIQSNQLLPSGTTASITVSRQGSPVNTIAIQLDAETTPPGNIGFFVASASSPISLPRLEPQDGFPLWIKRFVPTEAAAKSNDGFSLVIRAQSLEEN